MSYTTKELGHMIKLAANAGHNQRQKQAEKEEQAREKERRSAETKLAEEWEPYLTDIYSHLPEWAHAFVQIPSLPPGETDWRPYKPIPTNVDGIRPVELHLPTCTPIFIYARRVLVQPGQSERVWQVSFAATRAYAGWDEYGDDGHYVYFNRIDGQSRYNVSLLNADDTFELAVADAQDHYPEMLYIQERVKRDNELTAEVQDQSPARLKHNLEEVRTMLNDEDLIDYVPPILFDTIKNAANNIRADDQAAGSWACIGDASALLQDLRLDDDVQRAGEAIEVLLKAFGADGERERHKLVEALRDAMDDLCEIL